jgi:uncharacterized protein YcbK (DUF882 family)
MIITGKLLDSFTLSDMACNTTPEILHFTPDMFDFMVKVRDYRKWYNRPMKVNSWFRTTAYNKLIGGEENSMHLKGRALDFALPDEYFLFSKGRQALFIINCRNKWHEICGGYGGFGIYDDFIHIDDREVKSDWDYRTEK